MVPAANCDPEVFPEPDRFDISRGAQQHLNFGWGSHLCMRPHLTWIIAEEVIDLLLEEFPALALGERLEMATGLFFLGPSVIDLVGRRGAQVRQQGRPVPVAKAGRNDTCPCGSGKKYKRCHGVAA